MLSRKAAAAALSALAVGAGAGGCGSSSSSRVTPAAYMHSVCSSFGPFAKDIATRSSALNLNAPKTAPLAKAALENLLQSVSADTEKVVTQLKAAGTPDVPNGAKVSNEVLMGFEKLDTMIKSTAAQASSLPTSSPAALKASASSLYTAVVNSFQGLASLSQLNTPALNKAAAKDPSCKSIAG